MTRRAVREAFRFASLLGVIGVSFVAGRMTAAGPGIYALRGNAPWMGVHHARTGELMGEYRPRDGVWWDVLDDLLREHENRPVYPPVPAHLVGTPEPGCGPPLPDPREGAVPAHQTPVAAESR